MKKFLFIVFILILVLVSILFKFYFDITTSSKNSSSSQNSIFSIEKIYCYSGILPENDSVTTSSNWNLNISQYTDIAIYIKNDGKELSKSNTVQDLIIKNISYSPQPKIGTPELYYQNPQNFATTKIIKNYKIEKELNYNILNHDNSENFNNYSSPNFFIDCSNPITLKYVNKNIIKNYELSNKENLVFDGSILRNSNLDLTKLESTLNLEIQIKANDNSTYTKNIEIPIPIKNDSTTIINKNIIFENTNIQYFDKK